VKRLTVAAAAALIVVLAGCSGAQQTGNAAAAPAPAPTGAVGELATYGRELILHTRKHMQPYVTANMDCSACHVNAGTKARGGTFVGIAAQFPQWNKRAHRVIALQDRIAECFLYSMNGHPPAYNSREMLAMVAYITSLSRGTPIGTGPDPGTRLAVFQAPHPIDRAHGQQLYTQKCAACHGGDGAGSAAFPALWGTASFNWGAGMHRLQTMASFVRYNMPQNAPGSLSDQEAYDVAAFVLSHNRPQFKKSRVIAFPPQPAGYF
jgi:thiosulfate dehydrogenase